MYYIDTGRNTLSTYDYDIETGDAAKFEPHLTTWLIVDWARHGELQTGMATAINLIFYGRAG